MSHPALPIVLSAVLLVVFLALLAALLYTAFRYLQSLRDLLAHLSDQHPEESGGLNLTSASALASLRDLSVVKALLHVDRRYPGDEELHRLAARARRLDRRTRGLFVAGVAAFVLMFVFESLA